VVNAPLRFINEAFKVIDITFNAFILPLRSIDVSVGLLGNEIDFIVVDLVFVD